MEASVLFKRNLDVFNNVYKITIHSYLEKEVLHEFGG